MLKYENNQNFLNTKILEEFFLRRMGFAVIQTRADRNSFWDCSFWLKMSCSDSTIFIFELSQVQKSVVCKTDFFI